MKIYVVAPYLAMESSLKKIISKYKNIDISYGIGNLNDGLKLAKDAESRGFDVVVSRGGTARLIKKHINIPVVDMKLSGNDILKAILLADNGYNTAIVAYSNITTGAKEILELLGLRMKIYTINDYSDLTTLLIKLKKENVDQILGDIVSVSKAKEFMFETILFQSSYETIKIAIDYSIDLVAQINKSNIRNALGYKFFDSSNKDYCILNKNKIVEFKFTNFSKMPISYEKIIGLKYEFKDKLIDDEVLIDFSKDLQIRLSRTSYENQYYYLFKFNKTNAISAYPRGVSLYKPNSLYKFVDKSQSMKRSIEEFVNLINTSKLVTLCSHDEFVINNFLQYLYILENKSSNILLIDLHFYDFSNMKSLNLNNIKNIVFKNVSKLNELTEIKKITEEIEQKIFLTMSNRYWVQDKEIIQSIIDLPRTIDRYDDIVDIFNHYINFYNNYIGTIPIKLKEDFLDYFSMIRNSSIYELLGVLDTSIRDSKELVLSFEEFSSNYKKMKDNETNYIYDNLTLEEIEIKIIKEYLRREEYNQTKVADMLGISRATLWRKMKKYEI